MPRGQVRTGLVCGYCNGQMVRLRSRFGQPGNPRQFTSDHVFPACRPFDMPDWAMMNRAANRIYCCASCNFRKGDLHPLTWLLLMPGDPRLLIFKLHLLGVGNGAIESVMKQRLQRSAQAA